MENNKEHKFIDVEFIENDEVDHTEDKPIFYKTSQVSKELGVKDSTIRHWCKEYQSDDFLKVERSGRNRQFTRENIEDLKYVQKLLKQDGLSEKQVKEVLKKRSKNKDLIDIKENIKPNITIKLITDTIIGEIEDSLMDFQDDFNEIISTQAELINELKSDLSNKIEESNKLIKEYSILMQQKSEERDLKLVETLKQLQEDKKSENKNFFSKLFKK